MFGAHYSPVHYFQLNTYKVLYSPHKTILSLAVGSVSIHHRFCRTSDRRFSEQLAENQERVSIVRIFGYHYGLHTLSTSRGIG